MNAVAWFADEAPIATAEPDPPPKPQVIHGGPARLFVGVGVNLYVNSPQNSLRGCTRDASDVRAALVARGWTLAAPLLLDYAATDDACLDALAAMVRRLRPGDRARLWWSSHGTTIEDDEALCPTNALVDYPRHLVSYRKIAPIIDEVPDGAVLIIGADGCHTGDVDGSFRALNYRKAKALILPPGVQVEPPPLSGTRTITGRVREGLLREEVITTDPRVVLLSGCRREETSADTVEDGVNCGAMTWSWRRSLGGAHERGRHDGMLLALQGRYTQHPQLEATVGNMVATDLL